MILTFRSPFKVNNIKILRILIREKENKDLSQTIKKMTAKIMRIYCELGLIFLRYTEYLVNKNGEFSLMS
jgi:hypothetical protein